MSGAGRNEALVVVDRLRVQFASATGLLSTSRDTIDAVKGITLHLARGETVGLVGESGSGKTTVGRAIAGLQRPTSGAVRLGGEDIWSLRGGAKRDFRRRVQVVFQDPFASLNPRMSVRALVAEPIRRYQLRPLGRQAARVDELLGLVGLPQALASRTPAGISGGQRQRVVIARALAAEPELLILDEPVSALDVSIRAQILNLLVDLRERLDLTYLLIAHDLSIVRWISDRVIVMYHGQVVEEGSAASIFGNTSHPFTAALMSAIPVPSPAMERERLRIVLTGDSLSPAQSLDGCDFADRCWLTRQLHYPAECAALKPTLTKLETSHAAACHFAHKLYHPSGAASRGDAS